MFSIGLFSCIFCGPIPPHDNTGECQRTGGGGGGGPGWACEGKASEGLSRAGEPRSERGGITLRAGVEQQGGGLID